MDHFDWLGKAGLARGVLCCKSVEWAAQVFCTVHASSSRWVVLYRGKFRSLSGQGRPAAAVALRRPLQHPVRSWHCVQSVAWATCFPCRGVLNGPVAQGTSGGFFFFFCLSQRTRHSSHPVEMKGTGEKVAAQCGIETCKAQAPEVRCLHRLTAARVKGSFHIHSVPSTLNRCCMR